MKPVTKLAYKLASQNVEQKNALKEGSEQEEEKRLKISGKCHWQRVIVC
jgi:hypothetical protein